MHRFSKIKQLNPELEINFKTCERCTANEKCGTNGTLKQAHEAPKIGLDLSHAELRRANLSGLDLQYTEMHHAQLTNAKLIGTNLTRANLNSASFTDSTLVNVNMRDTDLRLSGFDNSHITDVDMTNAQLDNVTIANTTSTNLTLAGATLNDGWITTSSFKNANFSGAQLERTSFMLTNLDDANLQSSNLTQTTFAFVSMDRTDFRKTHLQRANIRAKECQQWDRALLEPSSQFQLDRARFNPLDLPARSVNVLREGLQQFENNRTRNSANKPAMAGNDNLLYLQYTLQAMRQRTDPALQQRATDIYCNQYLKQNNVALHTQSALFEPPESSLPLPEDGLNIVLMGRSGGALICSPETYHKMITGEESDAWNNIGVYKFDAGNHSSVELSAKQFHFRRLLAEEYPKLLPAWEKANIGSAFAKVLEALDLPEEFAARFQEAAEVKALPDNKKLVNGFAKTKLLEAFSRYYTVHSVTTAGSPASLKLNADHQHKLLSALKLTNAPPEKQAQALLVLGMIMTKASSITLFGTENDSPEALRYYASALLSAAQTLSSDVGSNATYRFWQTALLGDNCSSQLFIQMQTHLKQELPESKNMLELIMPRPWQ